MSAPALAGAGGPALRLRGTTYPVLLPSVRDPRLHLAAVIVTLQVLGQAAFDFPLSIAQIVVSLGTCAALEAGITFRRQRVIMWPASALLTGNGVAFILRVPGTEHGDWWSLRGWWIFAATAAVSLMSKHLVRVRGRHVFNPSNIGLVICFLALGKDRAEPLHFWWAPMSTWLAVALGVIVAGGLVILSWLLLLSIAIGFWLSFAAAIGLLAATGHAMTARWHLGPIQGGYFWWLLVSSPEILVFLFFMITDPKTIPNGRAGRRAYAVGVGLLAALLIAPMRTEYASKVALLGALAIVCAAQPLLALLPKGRPARFARRLRPVPASLAAAGAFAGALVLAGIPARSAGEAGAAPIDASTLPVVTILPSPGVETQLRRPAALRIARDLVADLRGEADALRLRDSARAVAIARGARLTRLQARVRAAAGRAIEVPSYHAVRLRVHLEPGQRQSPTIAVAALEGSVQLATYTGSPPMLVHRLEPTAFRETFELVLRDGRFVIVGTRGA